MSSDAWTTADRLQSARADVSALLTILGRHRHQLSGLEAATLDAISGRHGFDAGRTSHIAPPPPPPVDPRLDSLAGAAYARVQAGADSGRSERLMGVADEFAGLSPEQRAACEAELAMMRRGR